MPIRRQDVDTPWARYQHDIESGAFSPDTAQARAAAQLQSLYQQLCTQRDDAAPLARLLSYLPPFAPVARQTAPGGLYLWGGVGRGKTWLMDNFCDALPLRDKRRVHFHRFMQDVHQRLQRLSGKRDPLKLVARQIARQARVLCLDEFFVSDIGDAMILSGLLHELMDRGVTLVATSNTEPDQLYLNGLQRERFLPAIELIKQHTRVCHLAGDEDFRLRTLNRAEIYHSPLDAPAEQQLHQCFAAVANTAGTANDTLLLSGRPVPARLHADGVVWFDFAAIAGGPRSQADYIELAYCYNTVIVSGIPQLGEEHDDQALRLVYLVDEFYDRNVKLIISAEVPPEALYRGRALNDRFRRTISRLQEMQSQEYLARPHLA